MQIRKLAPGDRLLDYRILEKIGEGGFGEVFRAEHEVLGRIVAIKVPRDLEALSALRLEGVIQATLDHPAIVKTLEISISHDPPYVVMEHVDGMSLAEMIKKEGPLHWKRATRILLEAGRALKHAHERGVVHGDVKPGNVLVEPGEEGRVRLTDFGLGRVFEGPRGNVQISRSLELATSGPEVQGTLRYLAPEVQRGEPADERSDIYSWGVLAFEAVTGKLPEGREVPSDLVKSCPAELDQVFEACFQRREKRPRSLDSGIVALEKLLATGPQPKKAAEDLAVKASSAIPFRAHDGATLVSPIKPETPDALHALRMLGSATQPGAVPALPADGTPNGISGALPPRNPNQIPLQGLTKINLNPGAFVTPPVSRVAPGEQPPELDLGEATRLARTDAAFGRWREAFLGCVKQRFEARPAGARVVAGEGFDLGLGVTTEGEPHHRIYTVVLPYVDQDTARRLVKTARQVFEREKGIWEKEVTFALLAREVREKELVLMALRSLPMGWWRRRRVVLHDLAQDKLYATELGCDPRGNPLKRLFFDAVREANVQTSQLAQVSNGKRCCGRAFTVRTGRECVRNGLLGVGLAMTATLGLLAGAISVEKGLQACHGKHRHFRNAIPVSTIPLGPSLRADPTRPPPIEVIEPAPPVQQVPNVVTPAPEPKLDDIPRTEPVPAPKLEAPKTELPRTQTREAPKVDEPSADEPDEGIEDQAPAPKPEAAPKKFRF